MQEKNKDKLGLVLEGGGARGVYQTGALRALFDAGYKFDGVVGTSVGALNGVMIAQNRFDDSYQVWNNMEFSSCFDVDEEQAVKLADGSYDIDTIKYFIKLARGAIRNGGVDTSKIKAIIRDHIDENILRHSGIDFGVMTVSVSTRKPCPIFVEDMPEGTVSDYVMASATFPGFQKTVVGDNSYIDGGLYDNMPVNMLLDKGYRDIVAIETKSIVPKRKPIDEQAQILYIRPSEKPGRVMDFSKKSKNRAIKVGYFDTLRILKGYKGEKYYIDVSDCTPFGYGLCDFPRAAYFKMSRVLDRKYTSEADLLHSLNKTFRLNYVSIADCFINLIERVATAMHIDRLQVYTLSELLSNIDTKLADFLSNAKQAKYRQEMLIVAIIIDFWFKRIEV